jgi:hypothetical protein
MRSNEAALSTTAVFSVMVTSTLTLAALTCTDTALRGTSATVATLMRYFVALKEATSLATTVENCRISTGSGGGGGCGTSNTGVEDDEPLDAKASTTPADNDNTVNKTATTMHTRDLELRPSDASSFAPSASFSIFSTCISLEVSAFVTVFTGRVPGR